jgi:hypothetical protein
VTEEVAGTQGSVTPPALAFGCEMADGVDGAAPGLLQPTSPFATRSTTIAASDLWIPSGGLSVSGHFQEIHRLKG